MRSKTQTFLDKLDPDKYPEVERIKRQSPHVYRMLLDNYRRELLMAKIVPNTMPACPWILFPMEWRKN